jgi:hypothetical protein
MSYNIIDAYLYIVYYYVFFPFKMKTRIIFIKAIGHERASVVVGAAISKAIMYLFYYTLLFFP